MGKLLAVFRREYLERVRSKWFVIATLFGPIFFGLLMVVPSLLASRTEAGKDANNIEIIDATGIGLGAGVRTRLSGGATGSAPSGRLTMVSVDSVAPAESLATQRVTREELKGYLVLDSATLTTGEARYAGSNTTAILDMQRLERAVQREVLTRRMTQLGVEEAVGNQLLSLNVDVRTERLNKQGRGGSGQLNLIVGLTVAMLLYLTIFIYGLNVLRGVLEEKQSRVAEVVIASVHSNTLLAGKVLGVGAVGFTQLLIWFATSALMFQVRAPILAKFGASPDMAFAIPTISWSLGALLLGFFVLGFLFYAGLFAAVGATINTEQEAQQAQMPIVLLLVSSIIFAQNVLMQPDGSLARIMSLLPFSAPIILPLRMTVSPVPPLEIALGLLSVALGAVFTTWLAGRIYRVGLLMYGKRPSVGEILRWVRAG